MTARRRWRLPTLPTCVSQTARTRPPTLPRRARRVGGARARRAQACRQNAPVALQAMGEAVYHQACAHSRRVHHLEGCALERKGAACIQCNAVRQARALARCGRSLSPGAADSHAHAKLERNGVHPSVSFGRPFGSACALRSRLHVVCLPQRHAVVVAASFAVCRGPARVGQLPRWRLRGASALPVSAGIVEMVLQMRLPPAGSELPRLECGLQRAGHDR